MEHSGVLGEGFQIVAFPAAIEIARFLQNKIKKRGFNRLQVEGGSVKLPAIYSNGKVERRQDADDAERIRNCSGTHRSRYQRREVMGTRSLEETLQLTFEYGMAWPLRIDHPSIHHPRKPNRIIALRIEEAQTLSKPVRVDANARWAPTTHNVDNFLNLAHSLGTDLTHLERHERAQLVALQKENRDGERWREIISVTWERVQSKWVQQNAP